MPGPGNYGATPPASTVAVDAAAYEAMRQDLQRLRHAFDVQNMTTIDQVRMAIRHLADRVRAAETEAMQLVEERDAARNVLERWNLSRYNMPPGGYPPHWAAGTMYDAHRGGYVAHAQIYKRPDAIMVALHLGREGTREWHVTDEISGLILRDTALMENDLQLGEALRLVDELWPIAKRFRINTNEAWLQLALGESAHTDEVPF